MDVAHSRSLGFAGKEILFRKVEFERYRKPHVVEYPRSAIVLNPQHTQQLRDAMSTSRPHGAGGGDASSEAGDSEKEDGHQRRGDGGSDEDDNDDPRRMDPATRLCSDAQLRSSLRLRWQSITPVGLGLVNLGNTCFANSVLQALAHTPALAQYFMSTFRSADNQLGSPFDFAFALAETFRKMHHASSAAQSPYQHGRASGSAGAYRPGQLMGNLRLLSKHFSIGRQSDAHEFAVQLLFACQKSILHRLVGSKKVQPRVAHTTALYRICGGFLLSQVTWSRQDEMQQLLRAGKQQAAMDLKMEAKQLVGKRAQQRHRASRHGLDAQTLCSNTYDPFTILSVELAGHTLQHCLDKFCATEELDGRCYLSPREVGVRAKKKFSIHVPPPVLAIHVKRFGPTGNKINKHVQFPLELDITPYCTPAPSHVHAKDAAPANPTASSSSWSPATGTVQRRAECQYELNAICVHEGRSIDYGHYYAMAKAPNGMWYEFNDSHVSRLSEDQLQRAQAYMLFYSRKPAPPSPTHAAAATAKKSAAATAADGLATPRNGHAHSNGNGHALRTAALPSAETAADAVGTELSEVGVQALLAKRRAQQQQQQAHEQEGRKSDADAEAAEANGHATKAAERGPERAQTYKRMRESLPTDSDDEVEGEDEEGSHDGDGSYARRLRPTLNGRSTQERREDTEAGDQPPPTTAKASLYGGLIKSMKRAPRDAANGHESAGDAMHQQQRSSPAFRVGRNAVQALHTRKAINTPETVRRPTTAPKFQQRIRDPMWEMEMDRGKVKKVKSKEKAPDVFEGTNPFQEVSRGMFDVRGRRRRE